MAKRVLVVDDDQNTVKFLSVALKESGYDPVGAHDGKEGLEKVQADPPDLIILDVMMPKKSGFVLFKQLRQRDETKGIPVIMLTGVAGVLDDLEKKQEIDTFESPYDGLRQSLRKNIEAMREEGIVKPEIFLDKPVDPEDVISKVRDLIGT